MRIGIVPSDDPNAGGVYQYGLTMLQILHQCKKDGSVDEFSAFSPAGPPANLTSTDPAVWLSSLIERPSLSKRIVRALREFVGEGPYLEAWRRFRKTQWDKNQPKRERTQAEHMIGQFRSADVELLIYPYPVTLAAEARIPYVMAIHDLQHRLQPEFPEVSADGEWERRENLYRHGIHNATLLVADSEVGKEDILNYYGHLGIRPDQVKVLPFLPASYLTMDVSENKRRRVRATYRLPKRYLFYPAQFWPHKNHKRIVEALGLLKEDRGLQIDIVFCGSHSWAIRERAFHEVMDTASRVGVDKNIHYLGYISNNDISAVYAEASGLVMPTFFGPTNIPILEAWAFGCPVLSSDIRGIREQVQDAGILVDPRSVDSIAHGIQKLWSGGSSCDALVRKGRDQLATYTPAAFRERLVGILEEAKLQVGQFHNLRAQSI